MAQCLSSPSLGALCPHKATGAALAICPECCCLSSAALCTNRIASPCLYPAARKMWVKVEKCCPSWKGAALDISKSDTFFTLSSAQRDQEPLFKLLQSGRKKRCFCSHSGSTWMKTIPSSNWVALVGANMMYGCATWKTAAANMSHRDKSWCWLLDLTLPWTNSVWCTNIPALLFPTCLFCKKSVLVAALKIIYSTVLQGEAETANGGSRLPSQDIFNYRISKFQSLNIGEKLFNDTESTPKRSQII